MSELATLRTTLQEIRRSILEAVEGLPPEESFRPGPAVHPDDGGTYRTGLSDEEANWSPGRGVNSVATLLFHLAESERYWVCASVGGESFARNREAEFNTEPRSLAASVAEYRAAGAAADRVLAGLEDQDLNRLTGGSEPVRAVLLRILVHHAHHRGQILLLKHLKQAIGNKARQAI